MKRFFAVVLSLALILCVVPVSAVVLNTEASYFDSASGFFKISEAPKINYIEARSSEQGTEAFAYFAHSDAFLKFSNALQSKTESDNDYYGMNEALIAELKGDTVASGSLTYYVQFAYSFDGVNWKGTEENDTPSVYTDPYTTKYFDYCQLFNGVQYQISNGYYPEEIREKCDDLFLGKGIYPTDDDTGISVDLVHNTLRVKARYVIFNEFYNYNDDYISRYTYSPWSETKSYNESVNSCALQDCNPVQAIICGDEMPSLKVVNVTKSVGENNTKVYSFKIELDPSPELRRELGKSQVIHTLRDDSTSIDSYDEPIFLIEIKRGNSDWYYCTYREINERYFMFNTEYESDLLERLGNLDDTVSFRVTLANSNNYERNYIDGVGLERLSFGDTPTYLSATSEALSISLSGVYKINYFSEGSLNLGAVVRQFDDESDEIIDLTDPEYIPEYEHHVFDGWYTDAAYTERITSIDTKIKRSYDLYGKFTENAYYTVRYNLTDVSAYAYHNNPVKIYEGDRPVVLRDAEFGGATFLGWFTAPIGGQQVTELSYGTMDGDTVLYAHWRFPSKTITYAGAGTEYDNNPLNPTEFQITGTGENCVYIYAPTKAGYTFLGWSVNDSSRMLSYSNEKMAYVLDENDDVTLHAKWAAGVWDIKYRYNIPGDFITNYNPVTHVYGTKTVFKNASRNGYVFKGWFSDPEMTKSVTEIPETNIGETTVFGKFEAISYKINYVFPHSFYGEQFVNDNPTVRTVTDRVVLKPLTPNNSRHLDFVGFYDNVNYNGSPVTEIKAETAKDITLYVKVIEYSWGDIDLDGSVTVNDARAALRIAVRLTDSPIPDVVLAWADVANHSAEHKIDVSDARTILRFAVKLDSSSSVNLPAYPIFD